MSSKKLHTHFEELNLFNDDEFSILYDYCQKNSVIEVFNELLDRFDTTDKIKFTYIEDDECYLIEYNSNNEHFSFQARYIELIVFSDKIQII